MNIRGALQKTREILFGKKPSQNTVVSETIDVIDQDSLLSKLEKADVVSFDIFDTLITRKIYSPEDVFAIIEDHFKLKDFKENRIQADSMARTKLGRDITIDDIYTTLKESFDLKNADAIKKYEEKLELELCVPRKSILEIFNTLKKQGTTIILTSDMYLKQETIKKMLSKCGYSDFSKLYLSNQLDARKDTKTIWPLVKSDFEDKKIIHIGDNDLSDVSYPKEFGIETVKIYTGKDLALHSSLDNYIKNSITTPSDSLFWGTVINEFLFNSPFQKNPSIENLQTLGFIFYGPIFENFFDFLEKHTKNTDKLLFLSREGYYLQKLYQKRASLNHLTPRDNYYFLASRKAVISANFTSLADINNFAQTNYYSGSVRSWFKQILDIDIEVEDFNITLPDDYDKVKPLIDKKSKAIIKASKTARENYLLYVKQTVKNLNSSTKLIDLGYSGTIQYELSNMLKKDLCGIYLASSKNVKHYSKESRLHFLFDATEHPEYIKIYEYSLILEFFLSAPYGQLLGFNKKGARAIPIYNDEKLDDNKLCNIESIKQGIEQYLKSLAKFKSLVSAYNVSIDSIFKFYTYCVEQNIINKETKDRFDFTDSFTTDETKNVFKIISKY